MISDLVPKLSWKVLDVGTSTGSNLRLLNNMGFEDVTGLDLNPEAIRFCAEKGLGDVKLGDVENLPFENETFDLILATDIIEHVDDDGRAVRELQRVLTPGGKLLITVPAFRHFGGTTTTLPITSAAT